MCFNRITVIRAGEIKGGKLHMKDVEVPCGKCVSCKKRRVNEWVVRLQYEEQRSTSSYFITLTYDTDNVPISENGFMTLNKTDLTKFFKRLRKNEKQKENEQQLKYYAAGEYGSKNNRPHYHIIMFNLRNIDSINETWGLGSVHVGTVTAESCAYTCKYIDKESTTGKHKRDDRVKEYSVMSKHLGDNYLTEAMINWHLQDINRNYTVKPGGYKVPLSKYYRDRIYDDSDKAEQRKIIEENIEEEKNRHLTQLNGDYDRYIFEIGQKERFAHVKFYHNQKLRD